MKVMLKSPTGKLYETKRFDHCTETAKQNIVKAVNFCRKAENNKCQMSIKDSNKVIKCWLVDDILFTGVFIEHEALERVAIML